MACDRATTTGLVAAAGFITLDEPDFTKGIREQTVHVG